LIALVEGRDSSALLVAVDRFHGGITRLDRLMGEKRGETPSRRLVGQNS
jgi:hypothetical protein